MKGLRKLRAMTLNRRRSALSAVVGCAAGTILVLVTVQVGYLGWDLFSHVTCELGPRLGNESVWIPAQIVAAPFNGFESGALFQWTNYSPNRSTSYQNYTIEGGNVTGFNVALQNWTIYSTFNVTQAGSGLQSPCQGSMTARLSPTSIVGGGTSSLLIATGMKANTGLANGLNGSSLCLNVTGYPSNCGVGSSFNINFRQTTGTINTCDLAQSQIIDITSEQMPVDIPFTWHGVSYAVSAEVSNTANNGTFAWYNYTFPAGGGIWQYDNLAQTSNTGAGLVFSYRAC
jgi:hypothetical protein